MGMYDSVWVNCPQCNEESEFQSKGGECLLYSYTLENCPNDVLSDVNRHSPNTCDCGASFEIDVENRRLALLNKEIEETFEKYTKRVNPSLYSSFLAQKKLKNRKPICKTYDGVNLFEDDKYFTIETDYLNTPWKIVRYVLGSKPNGKLQFSTQEKAYKYLCDKAQRTTDGFNILSNEEMFVVNTKTYTLHRSNGGNYRKDNGKYLLFKEKVNAQNCIILNKKTLSIFDLDNIIFNGEEKLELIRKVKTELGF